MRADEDDSRTLEQRLRSTRAVRQVVSALRALTRSQLPRVESAAADAAAYQDAVERVVARLASAPRGVGAKDALHVVVGPERGWCGALARELLAQVPLPGLLGLVGKRLGEEAAGDAALNSRVRFVLPAATSPEEAPEVARAVATAVLEPLGAAHVELWHPTGGTARLRSTVLLGGPRARRIDAPETLSPWREVLRVATFEAIAGRLATAAVEALRTETRARAAAAEQAFHAAERQLEALTLRWRAARQEQITTELLELVAGRAAMLGQG